MRKFSKNLLRILRKIHYYAYFSKNLNKLCVNFSRVWTKNANCREILKFFDEDSIEKWNFVFFRKFVTKNRAFGNNTIFYNNFSVSGGGGSPLPPGYALESDQFEQFPPILGYSEPPHPFRLFLTCYRQKSNHLHNFFLKF